MLLFLDEFKAPKTIPTLDNTKNLACVLSQTSRINLNFGIRAIINSRTLSLFFVLSNRFFIAGKIFSCSSDNFLSSAKRSIKPASSIALTWRRLESAMQGIVILSNNTASIPIDCASLKVNPLEKIPGYVDINLSIISISKTPTCPHRQNSKC